MKPVAAMLALAVVALCPASDVRALTPTASPSPSAQRGTQVAPDDHVVLINKRLGEQQWAIVVDLEANTAAGNVFNLDGSDPAFVYCDIESPDPDTQEDFVGIATVELECFVAPGCSAMPCGGDAWQSVGARSIPGSFFLPPAAHTVPTPSRTPTPAPTPFCGNGTCNPGETCSTCAADCGQCAEFCGDGFCQALRESCVSCPDDCGGCAPFCGDGTCNGGEGCGSCPADCGTCGLP